MARAIVVARGDGGKESRFTFQAIDRDKLYGQRKKVVVDERGELCVSGHLSSDGSVLLLPGSRAMLYLDESSDVVDRSTLVAIDAAGTPLIRLDSTLDSVQPLFGPVPPERVLDHNVIAIYQIDAEGPDALDPELMDSLVRGEIWETAFNYMAGYERHALFILQGFDGLYGLVAETAEITWVSRNAPPPAEGEDALAGDELDFSMF